MDCLPHSRPHQSGFHTEGDGPWNFPSFHKCFSPLRPEQITLPFPSSEPSFSSPLFSSLIALIFTSGHIRRMMNLIELTKFTQTIIKSLVSKYTAHFNFSFTKNNTQLHPTVSGNFCIKHQQCLTYAAQLNSIISRLHM